MNYDFERMGFAMENKDTNILQLEAKDIFNGVKIKKGNYKRYKATLDYSQDAIKINELSTRKNEFYIEDNKQYTDSVISVTFKYSVKDEQGKTIVKTTDLRNELYENGFNITFVTDKAEKKVHYVRFKRSSGSSRMGKCLFIREDLYKPIMTWSYMDICHDIGIKINLAATEAYIALTTSSIIDTISGIGKENILIIDEYISSFKDEVMATKIVNVDGKDRLKTAKDTVTINNNIWDGQCLLDSNIFGTAPNNDTIWVNGKYADKGMLLLRNRMFKGACFNTNIQQFFEDAGITDISQLNGQTMAKDIKDIKMICTKSCIKYEKFGLLENWLNLLEDNWGIVKYDKPTHHLMGKYVSTHYQLLNTVQFDRDETLEFLKPSMDYLDKLMNDTRVMRNHLKLKNEDVEIDDINSTDDFILTMMQLNDKFTKTQMYLDFRGDIRESFIKEIRKGHCLVEGNYSVLFGNGLEMLKATIKEENNPYYFNGKSVLNPGEIHCTNFKYGIELLGSRSPHCTMGNLLIAKNVECKSLDKYFNLSKQIVCLNSRKENILERLSSCDFDSDQMLLSDNGQLIAKIKENYNKFLVPTSLVEAKKVDRVNTARDKADLDIKTSVNKIGEIINLSQILNTYLWDKVNDGVAIDSKEIQDLYADIAQLDVMSCIEIDMAKKEFSIDNVLELNELRKKYKITTLYNNEGKVATEEQIALYEEMLELKADEQDYKYFAEENNLIGYCTKTVKPNFMRFTGNKKKKDLLKEANKNIDFITYKSTMCFLEDIVNKEFKKIKATKTMDITTFSKMFQTETKILTSKCNKNRVKNILDTVKAYKKEVSEIWSKDVTEGSSEEEVKKINTKKYKDALEKKKAYIKQISDLKVKAEDIKRIIRDLDNETQEVIKIRNDKKKAEGKEVDETKQYEIFGMGRSLLSILFKAHREEFLKLFEEQKEPIETLKLKNRNVDSEEIIKLYNLEFVVEKC